MFADVVRVELARARSLHPPVRCRHEAYAVIKEELDEFWEYVKRQHPLPEDLYHELVQIGAMAQRCAEDLRLGEPPGTLIPATTVGDSAGPRPANRRAEHDAHEP
jgi:hypothetical protein